MILAVTGLQRERRILAGPGVEVVAGGGDQARLEAEVDRLAPGARGIISIGIAGALAPALRPGRWVVGHGRRMIAARRCRPIPTGPTGWSRACPAPNAASCSASIPMAATAGAEGRAAPRRQGASPSTWNRTSPPASPGSHRRPFVAARVISDAAHRTLPPAARVGMRADGGVDLPAVLRSLLVAPWQLPALIRTGLRGRDGLSRLTPRPPAAGLAADSGRPEMSASFRPTWSEKTNSAGRWPSSGMSARHRAVGAHAAQRHGGRLQGRRTMSFTAEASKPQWTMQSAHFSYLPTPYLSHSVVSMSSRKVAA